MKTKYGTAQLNPKGYYIINSKKEGNYTKRLHRLIWEDHYNQKIPKGYVIHHMNGDTTDNRIQNLQCVTRGRHTAFHHQGNTVLIKPKP